MKWFLAALVLLLALATLAGAWVLGTEPGLRWTVARLQAAADDRIAVRGLRGSLADGIGFDEIRYRDAQRDVSLREGELRLELLAFLGGRAGLRSLRAQELDVVLGDAPAREPSPPSLPLALRIERADIARVRFRDLTLENLELEDATLRERGAISASAAFVIKRAAQSARVRLQVGGSLERMDVAASGSSAEIPFSARAQVLAFSERPLQLLEAQVGPADLSRLDASWPSTALTLALSGKAGAGSALSGTLALRNALPGPLDTGRLPLTGADARFATDFGSLELADIRLSLGAGGVLSGSGALGPKGAELDLRAHALDLRALRSTLRRTRLDGPLQITAGPQSQSVRGTLAQAGMSLTAHAVRTGDVVDIRSLRAKAEGGEASGTGRLHLSRPMRVEAKVELARFDPARFGDYPQGSINGKVEASGIVEGELDIDARWSVRESTLRGAPFASSGTARISRNRFSRADAQASLGGATLAARGALGRPSDELAVEFEAPDLGALADGFSGRVQASGTLTGTWREPRGKIRAAASRVKLPNNMLLAEVSVTASGALAKHEGEIRVKAEGLDLAARLRGGWQPSGWAGELLALRNSGAYPMQLVEPATLSVAPGRLETGRLQARLGEGRLLVKALAWDGASLSSSGEFRGLPAQWLVLAGGLTARLRTSLLLDGHWNLAAAPRLNGEVALRRASGDVALDDGRLELGLEKAVLEARFREGEASVAGELAFRYGTVDLQGKVHPDPQASGLGFSSDSRLEFLARVRFAEMRVLTQAMLEGARLDGRLAAELRVSGTLGEVSLNGSLEGDAIELQVPPYGVFLKEGELRAVLEGDQVRITRFSIRGGEGRLSATGTLPLRFADGAGKLAWRAENFGLLDRPDLRLIVSGAGEAAMAGKKVSLSGALRAERGYLELEQDRLPHLGDDVVIVGKPRPAPRKERARLPVALDMQLDLGEQLQVRGYGLEGRLGGRLQLETTADGELRAYGRIHTIHATFLAYGHRLEVDPGVAIFDGPLNNPSLQMTAWRRNQQVEAGVQISGTARAPRVQLVSQPPVPEGERLSWLVLGRAPGEATKADLGLLQAAAGALLARGDQMPLDRRIAQAFGLDEISLRGSGEVGDRVVAVGKRLSDRLYVSYEQGLGIVASALVKLDLALTQRLSVRAETGTSSGVGLFYRFSWD